MGNCMTANSNNYLAIYNRTIKSIKQQQAKQLLLAKKSISLLKYQKSDFQQILDNCKRSKTTFVDQTFRPPQCLGQQLKKRQQIQWRTIEKIIDHPRIYDIPFNPEAAIRCQQGYCYIISTMLVLISRTSLIQMIFPFKQYSSQGIYLVRLLFNGQIQQIVVDSLFPVNKNQQPYFALLSNSKQFWPILLQKAWAKLNGSYQAIIEGLPNKILRAVTMAPTFLYMTDKSNQKSTQTLWYHLVQAEANNFPTCCSTYDRQLKYGLQKGQTYAFVGAFQGLQTIYGRDGKKLIKLRNPRQKNWSGKCSHQDSKFWNDLKTKDQRRISLLKDQQTSSFVIQFSQFMQFFEMVDISHFRSGFHLQSIKLRNMPRKHAQYISFQLQQNSLIYISAGFSDEIQQQINKIRFTFIVIEKVKQGHNYVAGKSFQHLKQNTLQLNLSKGSYIIYLKAYQDFKTIQAYVSIYSSQFITLKHQENINKKYKTLLRQALTNHAFKNTTGRVKMGQDWVQSKLLYQECGLAYLQVYVNQGSNKVINIQLDEQSFLYEGFVLKKPYKNIGKSRLQIDSIKRQLLIIARVDTSKRRQLQFPPSCLTIIDSIK